MTQIELDSLSAIRSSLPNIADYLEKLAKMKKLIKLRTLAHQWDSYNNHCFSIGDGTDIYVQLGSITKVFGLTPVNTWTSWDNKLNKRENPIKTNVAQVIGGGAVNLGLNGSDSSFYIDEESYDKLLKELEVL